ncbi:MAG TPA: exo-alpha-sialidase [Pirellulales bacterium]|jgi:hypothetical protein|nr:exo-alpha-sialidase [Pirellulales bacterium]
MVRRHFLALVIVSAAIATSGQAAPQIVSVEKIWDRGNHNAFTDLIRFHDEWFCTFREADSHVGGDGKLRVLRSIDGSSWESAALLAEEGIDLRDPKLSITADGRLMIVAGGSVYGGTTVLKERQPRVAFSPDARTWTPTQRVLEKGDWLWRVTWHNERAYGVAYRAEPSPGVKPKPEDRLARLVASNDGVNYELVAPLDVDGRANEATVRVLSSGEMVILQRREMKDQHGWIGTATAPFREFRWSDTGHRLGGPNFIELPDGALWAGSREHTNAGPRTVLARMTPTSYEPVLALPSGGDTSYPGLVWHDGLLWMSYYSSHEGKTSIYLAKIRLQP